MGYIATKVSEANGRVERALEEIARCRKALVELRASCPHKWRFVGQYNDHHEHFWNVTYKCVECDMLEMRKRQPPVCEKCDSPLVRASLADKPAERERKKPEHQGRMNPPIAFRCPKCQKIHILWHLGD